MAVDVKSVLLDIIKTAVPQAVVQAKADAIVDQEVAKLGTELKALVAEAVTKIYGTQAPTASVQK